MKSLLWVGDAGCPSGYGLATHKILETLHKHFKVTVLGINYNGDPHEYPYKMYCASPGGDAFGVGRLVWACDIAKPDVIVLQNDPWNIPRYIQALKQRTADYNCEYADVPVVGHLAVDGKNVTGSWIKDLTTAVFWTEFAAREARAGGFEKPSAVIPLGVDLKDYYPVERIEARMRRLPPSLDDAFIVGNVNRNQPRKRWDLTVRYFAMFIKGLKGGETDEVIRATPTVREDAFLYLHTAPTGDVGPYVRALAKYYGGKELADRLILQEPPAFYGASIDEMRDTYNCFDVQISTTQGEGFGLTTFEGMACGVPQIVPDWSALGELTKGAARLVPCTSTAIGPPFVANVIGGVADEREFIAALEMMYQGKSARTPWLEAGLNKVRESRFDWSVIGERWVNVLELVLAGTLTSEKEAVVA